MSKLRLLLSSVLIFLLICTSFCSTTAFCSLIVDTGPGLNVTGGYSLDSITPQWLAGEFELDQSYYITGLYGWLANDNQAEKSFTISLYGDGGETPDTTNLIYSNTAVIAGPDKGSSWEGYEINWTDSSGNTGQFLTAGSYWIAFEVRPYNSYRGAMPSDAATPLNNYSVVGSATSGVWRDDDYLNFGVRIFGTPAAVPEPGTVILFGIGLLGIVGVSRKKS